MPKISVVIPTHNRPVRLERAVLSVLMQSGGPWDLEVLVVGDDTDARTVQLMHEWMRVDSRVHFWNLPAQVYPEDEGQKWCVLGLEARNWGFDHATGDYIAGLDDDDIWLPDWLETMVPEVQRLGVDVIYGRSTAFNPDGSIYGRYGKWPPEHFSYCEGAWLAKHDLGYRLDPACIERGLPEDGDKIDRMVAGGVKFAFVDKVIHHYFPERR